ncbi:MAG: hypothetical protein WCT85_01005 [Parachlamydiales bacterium]
MNKIIALFGESEKGRYNYTYFCSNLVQLAEFLGNSPENSTGISFAIQSIMYEMDIIFFRVSEEGFSYDDYMFGLETLQNEPKIKKLNALCLPKVSNIEIINSLDPICKKFKSIIITTQKDLFDYLISR